MAKLFLILPILTACLLAGCVSPAYQASESAAAIEEDPGSRTVGEVIDDNGIEVRVKQALTEANPAYDEFRIRIISHNGKVLTLGQLPTQEMIDGVSIIAAKVRKVKSVHNEITLGPKITAGVRAADSWIGIKVKSKLFSADEFPSKKVTVMVENGIVYLLGIVTDAEADTAAELTASVSGVQKVVKLFELNEN